MGIKKRGGESLTPFSFTSKASRASRAITRSFSSRAVLRAFNSNQSESIIPGDPASSAPSVWAIWKESTTRKGQEIQWGQHRPSTNKGTTKSSQDHRGKAWEGKKKIQWVHGPVCIFKGPSTPRESPPTGPGRPDMDDGSKVGVPLFNP